MTIRHDIELKPVRQAYDVHSLWPFPLDMALAQIANAEVTLTDIDTGVLKALRDRVDALPPGYVLVRWWV